MAESRKALANLLRFLKGVQFQGVVGKLAALAIVCMIVLGLPMLLVKDAHVLYFIATLVFVVFLISTIAIYKVLSKHALPSILEGTDLISYYRVAYKHNPQIHPGKVIEDPRYPKAIESGVNEESEEE